jgi:hypothetical protein
VLRVGAQLVDGFRCEEGIAHRLAPSFGDILFSRDAATSSVIAV